ncbi:MAG TPA: carboxypeptidase-like regulatory domain-containing protein [Candidatus Polarisedimenticolaceae bacterium]
MTPLAIALLLALPSMQVVDRAGKPVPGATVACVDPGPGADPCRKVRCEAEGWIPLEVETAKPKGRCTLDRALTVLGEIPGPPRGSLEVRLVSARSADAVLKTAPAPAAEPGAPMRFAFPTTRAGSFRLEVARASDGWTCRTELGPVAGRVSVPVGWVEPAVVNGRAMDAEERPVPGLPVRSWQGRVRAERNPPPVRGAWTCRQDAGFILKTDPEGRFRLPVDGRFETLVLAGDLEGPAGVAWALVAELPTPPITLNVQRPVRLTAKVLDREDRPQACKARLSAAKPREAALMLAFGVKDEGTCDASGRLETASFPPFDWNLKVKPVGGMMVVRSGSAPASGTEEDLGVLRSEAGDGIEVLVVDPDDRPVSGAKVTASGSAGIVLTVESATGPDGRASLSGLPHHASIRVDVRAAGFTRQGQLTSAGGEPIRIRLERASSLSGTVIDEDAEPVAGAFAEVLGPKGLSRAESPTGPDGRFIVDSAPVGKLRVTAKADGYGDARPVELDLAGGERREGLEVVLPRADGVRGRVVDVDGRPVAGARVRLMPAWAIESYPEEQAAVETRSDADGSFTLPGTANAELVLIATATGYGPALDRAPMALAGKELTLTLAAEAKLRVRIVPKPDTPRNVLVVDGAGVAQSRWVGSEPVTFEGLASGQGRAGFGRRDGTAVTLAAGQTAETDLRSGGNVSGTVSADGVPMTRARVWVLRLREQGFDRVRGAEPDGQGRFRVEGLPEGKYRFVALAADGRSERDVQVADGGESNLDLPIARVLAIVRVRLEQDGRPVADAQAQLTPVGGRCAQTEGMWSSGDPWGVGVELTVSDGGCDFGRTGEGGVAVLRPAVAGEYTLAVTPKGYEAVERRVVLDRGENLIDVAVGKGARPKLRVVLDTDPPGIGGTLICSMSNEDAYSLGGVAGVAECPNAVAGRGLLVFKILGYGFGWASVDLPESGEVEARVMVRRGGRLVVPAADTTARPVLDDGSGAPWVEIVRQLNEVFRYVGEGEHGPAWVIDGVPPGRYAVSVGGVARGVVEVTAGGEVVAR